jgi:hypothetical protein
MSSKWNLDLGLHAKRGLECLLVGRVGPVWTLLYKVHIVSPCHGIIYAVTYFNT